MMKGLSFQLDPQYILCIRKLVVMDSEIHNCKLIKLVPEGNFELKRSILLPQRRRKLINLQILL